MVNERHKASGPADWKSAIQQVEPALRNIELARPGPAGKVRLLSGRSIPKRKKDLQGLLRLRIIPSIDFGGSYATVPL